MKKIKETMPAVWFLWIVVLCLGCHSKTPVIYTIFPQVGSMGEPVTVNGAFFGKDRGESYVTIADSRPTGTSYINWNDSEITFRVPEFGEAGLVYVHVNGKKSNGVLYANQATLPVQIRESVGGLGPVINSVMPQAGGIGTLVSITGNGFGSSRGNSGVLFTWNAQTSASVPSRTRVQEFVETAETEFGYELWTEREIRIYVPDGAVTGNMEVRTAKGSSPPVIFNLTGRPGTKTYSDKRSYAINYSVNVKVRDAETPNTLYLWIPRPAALAAQRNAELLLCSMEPFIEQYRGSSLFKLDNLTAHSEAEINLSWKIDVYGVETVIWPQSIRQETNSPISRVYTQSSLQLPSDDPRIKSQMTAILGRERNPYMRAQRIYEWMMDGNFVWVQQAGGDIFTMMETRQADSYLAALLYCTLLRSADIPCQPVAGVLVNRNQQTVCHYWVEFWIDGFGWIPVDPALGAGAVPASFNVRSDRASYYFGNIDNQRIAFSRGFVHFSPMDPGGRTVTHNRSYSLQNLWEESVGGIDYYSSLWGDITVTGIYVQ